MKCFLVIGLVVGLSSCVGAHYGYSSSEWDALSLKEQEEVKAEYKKTIAEKEKMKLKNTISKSTEEFVEAPVYACTSMNRNTMMCRD